MELILPVAIFFFALLILNGSRRAASRPLPVASGWSEDPPVRGPRLGNSDLENLKRAYAQFAIDREGRRLDRAPYEGPRVAYLHRSTRAVLSLHVVGHDDGLEDRFTQIAYLAPPGWRHRIEVGPAAGSEPSDSPVPGLTRVAIQDPLFERRTRVLASDPEIVRRFLDEPTRRGIDDLRALLENGHIHVSATANRILFRKRGVLRSLPEVTLFARLCDAVYDRLLVVWEREIGIEILDDGPTVSEDAPKCQVCSHPIDQAQRVRCRRCRTPHHPDCWEFNGGCATFACGEKISLKEVA